MKLDLKKIRSIIHSRFLKTPIGKRDGIMLERDWAFIAIGFTCSLIFAVSFGIYAFYMTISDEYLGDSQTEPISTKTLSRARLNNAIEEYNVRVDVFERLKRSRPTAPSI